MKTNCVFGVFTLSAALALSVSCVGAEGAATTEAAHTSESALATTPEAGEGCEVTAAWIRENAGRLPTTFEAVKGHSLGYRRAIYDASPPSVQDELWRSHFRAYMTSHPNLNQTQRSILDRLIANPRLDSIELEVVGAFGAAEANEVVGVIGEMPADPVEAVDAKADQERSASAVPAFPDCNCSRASNYCRFGAWQLPCTKITMGTIGCKAQSGCGFLWRYTCDGRCGW